MKLSGLAEYVKKVSARTISFSISVEQAEKFDKGEAIDVSFKGIKCKLTKAGEQ